MRHTLVDGVYKTRHELYKMWLTMINRCTLPSCRSYSDYGGRGIKVCRRWMNFAKFVSDMGPRPEGMTIHRVNNDRSYSPSNCIWATRQTQARNTRGNHRVTFKGETFTLVEWAERIGINYDVLYFRIVRGWPIDAALALSSNPRKTEGHWRKRMSVLNGTENEFADALKRKEAKQKAEWKREHRQTVLPDKRKRHICVECSKPAKKGFACCQRHIKLRRERKRRYIERIRLKQVQRWAGDDRLRQVVRDKATERMKEYIANAKLEDKSKSNW